VGRYKLDEKQEVRGDPKNEKKRGGEKSEVLDLKS